MERVKKTINEEEAEILESLPPLRRLAYQIFDLESHKRYVSRAFEDRKALALSVPDEVLESNSSYTLLKLASVMSLYLDRSDIQYSQSENGTDYWEAIKHSFARQISSPTTFGYVLFPFFAAFKTDQFELAKVRRDEKLIYPPYQFLFNRHGKSKGIKREWEHLENIGVIKKVWDRGEILCHWELNKDVYDTFVSDEIFKMKGITSLDVYARRIFNS